MLLKPVSMSERLVIREFRNVERVSEVTDGEKNVGESSTKLRR